MNLTIFKKLMVKRAINQNAPEWKTFLELCSAYLRRHNIKKPVVVEVGMGKGGQKRFYEQLLGAEYIGIDPRKELDPDICGDIRNPKTLMILKRKLKEKPANILFIDASRSYGDARVYFGMYSEFGKDIVALHNIECNRYKKKGPAEIWAFWDKLKREAATISESYDDFLFLSIYNRCKHGTQRGIGVLIKK